ncbi:MAG: hypothetical protein ACHQ9S_23560 [Candidatus Binatia bacterium]
MRGRTLPVLLVCGWLLPATTQAESVKVHKAAAHKQAVHKPSLEEVQQAFDVFCQEWMQKLAVREHDNIVHIHWDTKPDGVEGEYVGYTPDHTCVVKDGSIAPVGKIAYQEVRYAKRGKTVEEAQESPARPLETTAVTEIFRHDGVKWIY